MFFFNTFDSNLKKLMYSPWNEIQRKSIAMKTRKPSIELADSEMQYAIALEIKYKRLRDSHSLAGAVVLQKQFTTALSSCCADQSNDV